MDKITLEILKLNWRVQFFQAIAVKAYTTAYLALLSSQANPSLSEASALEAFHRMLAKEIEETKERLHQAFLSDPTVPEADRALLAEEVAHLFEEIKTSVISPGLSTPS